jgi:AraC family transcriptional regulator
MCDRDAVIEHSLQVDTFDVAEMLLAPSASVSAHRHPRATLLLCAAGRAVDISVDGAECLLEAGSLTYLPATLSHALRVAPGGCSLIVIGIAADTANPLPLLPEDPSKPFRLRRRELGLMADRIRFELRSAGSVRTLALKGLILRLLGTADRFRERHEELPCLVLARRYIDDRYLTPITAGDVAAAASIDPSRLARLFRRRFGQTVGDSIRLLRLCEATRLLRESQLRFSEVARLSGFHDASHLSRCFEEVQGFRPR